MKTFFFHFRVTPAENSVHAQRLTRGLAAVWAVAGSLEEARQRCRDYLSRHWAIQEELDGRETTLEDHNERPEGRALFLQAQVKGIAAGIVATGIDESASADFSSN
ncbi:MAG: hypothetical protein AB1705_13090 [Verrucomicrobiota bacterium]